MSIHSKMKPMEYLVYIHEIIEFISKKDNILIGLEKEIKDYIHSKNYSTNREIKG